MRVAQSGISEVPFNICINPIFRNSQQALVVAMTKSVKEGCCRARKKSTVIGVEQERMILSNQNSLLPLHADCKVVLRFTTSPDSV